MYIFCKCRCEYLVGWAAFKSFVKTKMDANLWGQCGGGSKTMGRAGKAPQVKGARARYSSGGFRGVSPKKLMNSYALRFGRIDLEAAFSGTDRRTCKADSGTVVPHLLMLALLRMSKS